VDKEELIVRLIHSTLHEWLSARPSVFSRPHWTMAKICWTNLNSKAKASLANRYLDPLRDPILEYCSQYWGVHSKMELLDCASALAPGLLLQGYYGHMSREFF